MGSNIHRKVEDTVTGDCSKDDDFMDIQLGPSTSSSRGGANGDASPTGGVCLFTSHLYPSNVITLHTSLEAVAVWIHVHSLVSLLCLFTTQRCATSGFESFSQSIASSFDFAR
ncbi:hypothetical protein TNCV_3115591 [Trichonephila clavipes]|nr:hypothetical protein TNCV_3115591 [Trichonephila clavipes]